MKIIYLPVLCPLWCTVLCRKWWWSSNLYLERSSSHASDWSGSHTCLLIFSKIQFWQPAATLNRLSTRPKKELTTATGWGMDYIKNMFLGSVRKEAADSCVRVGLIKGKNMSVAWGILNGEEAAKSITCLSVPHVASFLFQMCISYSKQFTHLGNITETIK